MTDSLYLFLQGLFKSVDAKMKIATAILQAARPCVILAPLQLGVQLHHHFASEYLIDTLHTHGFSCSYIEVTTYVAVTSETEIPNLTLGNFIQYAADNVDHNICTLGGHNVHIKYKDNSTCNSHSRRHCCCWPCKYWALHVRMWQDINQKLMAGKDAMKHQLTTSLWLQYLEMVTVLQTFIKATAP